MLSESVGEGPRARDGCYTILKIQGDPTTARRRDRKGVPFAPLWHAIITASLRQETACSKFYRLRSDGRSAPECYRAQISDSEEELATLQKGSLFTCRSSRSTT